MTMPEMGDFRWLSVAPPGGRGTAVVLMAIPGAPVFDEETRSTIREAYSKRRRRPPFLTTDDVRADYEALKARGVDSPSRPRSARTASTAASAIRPATTTGSRSATNVRDPRSHVPLRPAGHVAERPCSQVSSPGPHQ